MSADYTTTNERRRLLKYKWEPNIIVKVGKLVETATTKSELFTFGTPTAIKYYSNGELKVAKGTTFDLNSLNVDFNTKIEAVTKPNETVTFVSSGKLKYRLTSVFAKGVRVNRFYNSQTGNVGTFTFEDCYFTQTACRTDDGYTYGFFYEIYSMYVIYKNCTFYNEPWWFYGYCRPISITIDNINLTKITNMVSYYWNSELKELLVINNQNLTKFIQASQNEVKGRFTKIDFSNNPLLNTITIRQTQYWDTAATKQVFIDFCNTLPQRETDNRGTLMFRGNPYRTDSEVLAILSAKNWDYVAYS